MLLKDICSQRLLTQLLWNMLCGIHLAIKSLELVRDYLTPEYQFFSNGQELVTMTSLSFVYGHHTYSIF